jgi:hypothetical protein
VLLVRYIFSTLVFERVTLTHNVSWDDADMDKLTEDPFITAYGLMSVQSIVGAVVSLVQYLTVEFRFPAESFAQIVM